MSMITLRDYKLSLCVKHEAPGYYFALTHIFLKYFTVNRAIERCLNNGVIIYCTLSTRNSSRIALSLPITEEEIKMASKIILEAI